MTTKTFDPTKPVQTRDGRKARIICTDRKGTEYPIIALVEDEDGEEGDYAFSATGSYWDSGEEMVDDLINIPEREVLYANVYSDDESDTGISQCIWLRRNNAARYPDRLLGVIKVTQENGKIVSVELLPEEPRNDLFVA